MKKYYNSSMELAIAKERQYRNIDWCWMIILISFVGFLVENIWNILTSRQIDNRNMHLPFILGYGLAILGVYLLFGLPTDNKGLISLTNSSSTAFQYVAYILLVTVFICISEIIIGYGVQYFSGVYYWDFSDVPLHITRYTSILTSVAYSITITLFMNYLFDSIMRWFSRFDDKAYKYVGIILITLLSIDLIASYGTMIANNNHNLIWCIYM